MITAKPNEVIMPKGGLLPFIEEVKDRILGGVNSRLGEILNPEGNWFDFAPAPELQRNKYGDVYGCVSFSLDNILEILGLKQFNENTNRSDRFLVVGSGTIPGQGNSKKSVANWLIRNGYVTEDKYPYSEEMTIKEYYKKPMPDNLLKEGLVNKMKYDVTYEFLPDNSFKWISEGLKYSPLWVDVSPILLTTEGIL